MYHIFQMFKLLMILNDHDSINFVIFENYDLYEEIKQNNEFLKDEFSENY